MGSMANGVWHDDVDASLKTRDDGSWQRSASLLRNWVTPDGTSGPSGDGGFKAEAGRYHLYVAWNCPWAHRALIFRALKQLEQIIDVSWVRPRRTDQGWVFEPRGEYRDCLFGAKALHEIYAQGVHDYSGRVTVPVLWDNKTGRIVSNESAEIIRMFNTAFEDIAPVTPDYVPDILTARIDAWNDKIYNGINNGVYRTGFATTQEAYDDAVGQVFATLDLIEEQLSSTPYLCGDQPTEADWRLLPTLVRFDVAYYGAFKCNLRRIADYPNLWPYARRLYQHPGIAGTVRFDIYKQGYYSPGPLRNPLGIVPLGPEVDFSAPVEQ
jgi:glutathionyl-hydroquinone reductase